MKIGLWGARADAGGLAAMTYEFARHVRPDRIMMIDLDGRGRGVAHPERYAEVCPDADLRLNHGMNDDISEAAVRDFCAGLDVIYGAETFYRDDFCAIARDCGVRTVLHAMPELFRPSEAGPDRVWVPTRWELGRMPAGTQVVPVPVAPEYRPDPNRTRAAARRGSLLHMTAPAFHDRNGTDLVVGAMPHLQAPARIVFAGGRAGPPRVANVHGIRLDTGWLPGGSYDRRDAYPAECGALLLPRRYAGLSLPMQEAAGLGWPIITLDLDPQNDWVHPAGLVPAQHAYDVQMVGGSFPVHTCRATDLARAIERIVTDPDTAAEAATASADHAAALAWERWAPRYRDMLEA